MSDSLSLTDRYFSLIDQIVEITLQGQIRSKEQVYQMLCQNINPGTGEIFERCLADRLTTMQQQINTPKDELKQAKAMRNQRALKTIESEYLRWEKDNRVSGTIAAITKEILSSNNNEDRLIILLRSIDQNQQHPLTLDQLKQLAKILHQYLPQIANPDIEKDVEQILFGIIKGLESWQYLEPYLVSWIYDQSQGSIGFDSVTGAKGPWAIWSKQVNSDFPKTLFNTISLNQSIREITANYPNNDSSILIELAIILQCLQRGLITWFDKLVYDSKIGAKVSISIFITFIAIWCELTKGFAEATNLSFTSRDRLTNGCFQMIIQLLRTFAQRQYFPLYGGIFAAFSGNYLQDTLNYLDEPLRRVEGTQEKARILTLLGYSKQAQGQYDRARDFHLQALEIARNADDKLCEIANYNHLSRNCVAEKNYSEAINYSQRALIYSRQTGDRLGEANALANLGYSEVFQAQQLESMEPEIYETAINYLQQGLQLSQKLGDAQSKALCLSSLGIAHIFLEQLPEAIEYLTKGWQDAQIYGDLYLQGLNMAYLAEAYYRHNNEEKAIYTGCLGMYILEQINAVEWRQTAGLLSIIQGKVTRENFKEILNKYRANIISIIGVDGYDYLPQLLEKYQKYSE